MHAAFVQHAQPPLGVAEDDEVDAQQAGADGRAVGLGDLFGEAGRQPVLAHDLAHRRLAFDAAEQFVVFPGHHDTCQKYLGL